MVVARPTGPTNIDFLLDNEPDALGTNYAITYNTGTVTNEAWQRTSNSTNIKTIDYTYNTGLLSQEVRKVYAGDGTTIIGQVTITYSYTSGSLTSATYVRNV
jgi:hypothetical protein